MFDTHGTGITSGTCCINVNERASPAFSVHFLAPSCLGWVESAHKQSPSAPYQESKPMPTPHADTAHGNPATCPDHAARRLKRLSLLLGLSLVAAGSVGAAHAADPAPAGANTGSFRIIPTASLTETWDDNIYGTPTGKVSDSITTLDASVNANSNWARHRLNLDAGVSADAYADNDSEDIVDWWLGADGRYDLSAKSHALGGLRFSKEHEDRSSPDSIADASDPTTYLSSVAHLGLAHHLAPFTIRLGGVIEKLDFDTGSAPGFDINQRDRRQYSLGTRFSYQLKPGREIFLQASTDAREYDDSTVGRDSDGYRLGLGLRIKQGADFEVEGFIGHLTQVYDDIALKDVSALYFGGDLKWKPAAQTRVNATLDRSVNETTLSGASSLLDSTVGARIEHDLSSQLTLNAAVSYTNSDYQGVDVELNEFAVSVGARYYFDRHIFVSGDYRRTSRDSNVAAYAYDGNVVFLAVGYALRN
jgi:hypothetical protein